MYLAYHGRSLFREHFAPFPGGSSSTFDQEVFNTVPSLRWYLMPLQPPTKLSGKLFAEQVASLPPEYELASAVEEVLKRQLFGRDPGPYLLPTGECRARCRDIAPTGGRTVVSGGFSAISLILADDNVAEAYSLAVSRKLPVLE